MCHNLVKINIVILFQNSDNCTTFLKIENKNLYVVYDFFTVVRQKENFGSALWTPWKIWCHFLSLLHPLNFWQGSKLWPTRLARVHTHQLVCCLACTHLSSVFFDLWNFIQLMQNVQTYRPRVTLAWSCKTDDKTVFVDVFLTSVWPSFEPMLWPWYQQLHLEENEVPKYRRYHCIK